MAQAAIDPKVVDRFAELVGLGCTQHEAARAVRISERSGERLLTRPEVRARVDEARSRGLGLTEDVKNVLEALLGATTDTGEPAHLLRAKGAELLLKYKKQFEGLGEDEYDDVLPEGVYRVYPLPRE